MDDISLLYSPKVHIHQSYVFHLVDEHDLEEWKVKKLGKIVKGYFGWFFKSSFDFINNLHPSLFTILIYKFGFYARYKFS